ncbi:Abi family protein [Dermabacteraceae bacterium P13128]
MAKPFITYSEQVDLLLARGMDIRDRSYAEDVLRQINYYRLSGYWHTMRVVDPATGRGIDRFRDGATFELVVALYKFDERLRAVVLEELSRIEVAIRAALGYCLGEIDPFAYLDASKLGTVASSLSRAKRRGRSECIAQNKTEHQVWLAKYESALSQSTEDFVKHHRQNYEAKLPAWVAVEVMDWGMLSYLYRMAPSKVRDRISSSCGLTSPQLESWLKSLNVMRNYAAHNARMFNRSYDIKPRLNMSDSRLVPISGVVNRAFGQLTMVQYLHREWGLSAANNLPKLVTNYPDNSLVPISRLGVRPGWERLDLWQTV